MSFSIYLYNFKKRINSTKQPSLADGLKVDVVLKRPTTEYAPVFVLSGVSTFSYNYVSWGGRYYFIEEVTVVSNDIDEVRCKLDVMATFKSEIGSTSAFVEYSTSNYNTMILDQRLSMESKTTFSQDAVNIFSTNNYSIVVTCAGGGGLGANTAYVLSDSQFVTLCNFLYSQTTADELSKYFNSPFDAIIEAHIVQWSVSSGTTLVPKLGPMTITGIGSATAIAKDDLKGLTIHNLELDLTWPYNDFRNFSPYTCLYCYLPYIGQIQIDPARIAATDGTLPSKLYVDYVLDPLSGEVAYYIHTGDFLEMYRATTAVPLAIGQTVRDSVSGNASIAAGIGATALGLAGLASGAGSIAGVGAVAGGIATIGRGIMQEHTSHTSSKGSNGSFASAALATQTVLPGVVSVQVVTRASSQSPASMGAVCGRPCYKTLTISSLSGYVQCKGASVAADTGSAELTEINTYLNQGFYYE